MLKSKYSNFLTVVLIIAIIAIITIATILIVKAYKNYNHDKEIEDTIANFTDDIEGSNNSTTGQNLIAQDVELNNANSGNKAGTRKVKYYNNFVMLGYIEIPSIKIKYPILEKETVESLEQSVAIRYPANAPQLNEKGNIVIAGHNYRNSKFFSNLKKVSTGDKIKITDTNGKTLVYTVYEKYETTPEDTGYITRNVGENTEVTLVTCTDNSKARIIVKAKV